MTKPKVLSTFSALLEQLNELTEEATAATGETVTVSLVIRPDGSPAVALIVGDSVERYETIDDAISRITDLATPSDTQILDFLDWISETDEFMVRLTNGKKTFREAVVEWIEKKREDFVGGVFVDCDCEECGE